MLTFCKLLQLQMPGRILPAGIRLQEVTFGLEYIARSDRGIALQCYDLEDALAMIATEFQQGVAVSSVAIGGFTKQTYSALLVKRGWRPCDIDVLRSWVVMYNLTQSWHHVDPEELKVCHQS